MKRVYFFVRPQYCPKCHMPYRVDFLGRCVHCGMFLGLIKW